MYTDMMSMNVDENVAKEVRIEVTSDRREEWG
jgi:hypothetical protein